MNYGSDQRVFERFVPLISESISVRESLISSVLSASMAIVFVLIRRMLIKIARPVSEIWVVFFFSCFGSQVSVSNPAPKQQDPQKIVQPAAQLAAQPDAQPQPQDPLVQRELRGLTTFEFVTNVLELP